MQGIIYMQLKKYVVSTLGKDNWSKLLKECGLESRFYLPTNTYPDEEVVTLVGTASKMTGKPVPEILEDFGEFIVPGLIELYGAFVSPEWKTIDLIENTEQTIHKVVRLRNPGADPARLKTVRHSKQKVEVIYDSPRKMCGLAKGIIKGVGKHNKENITITESSCMLMGSSACKIHVESM